MYHSICPAHTARARCFVPAFHQSPRRHKELFGLGLRRIQCCDRFGVLAVLHCGARFPNRHGGFPVLTAAALRHLVRPLDAAPPAHADADRKRPHLSFCSRTQYSGRGGNLKKRSATARAGGCQTCRRSCIRGSAFPRFGSMNALDQKKSEHPTQRTLRAGRDTREARERSGRLPCPEWSTFTFA